MYKNFDSKADYYKFIEDTFETVENKSAYSTFKKDTCYVRKLKYFKESILNLSTRLEISTKTIEQDMIKLNSVDDCIELNVDYIKRLCELGFWFDNNNGDELYILLGVD